MPAALAAMVPMEMSREVTSAPAGGEWVAEIKFDGWRCLAHIDGGSVTLKTRRGANASRWFPEIVRGLSVVKGGPHIIDGECVVLDEVGRSDFNRLQSRAARRGAPPGCDSVVLAAFDLLMLDGRDITQTPLAERKAKLKGLLTPAPPSTLYVQSVEGLGAELFEQAKHLKLEGLVFKRAESRYRPGERTTDWVKLKTPGWNVGRRWQR